MAGVQGAHGRNQGDGFAGGPPLRHGGAQGGDVAGKIAGHGRLTKTLGFLIARNFVRLDVFSAQPAQKVDMVLREARLARRRDDIFHIIGRRAAKALSGLPT